MEYGQEDSGARRMMDTLVAGYLGRQKYWESLKCLMNESPVLGATHCGGMSIILGDTIHGKHLEEIIILFNQYGDFGVSPALFDFGLRLRSLANEFISLTNANSHWSDAQKIFYGKHVPSSRSHMQQRFSMSTSVLDVGGISQNLPVPVSVDSTTTISSQHSTGSSTRRKCSQPVNINTKRREFLKEIVEPVVHTAQQIMDNSNGNSAQPSSSFSGLSMITIDENAFGTLNRCMAQETFAELIESIEKDLPDGFFDSFSNSDTIDGLHGSNFGTTPRSNETQQESQQKDDISQNLYNIPQANNDIEMKPSCISSSSKTCEKSLVASQTLEASNSKPTVSGPKIRCPKSQIARKPVIAESAIFKERVEVECQYLPIKGTGKPEPDGEGRELFLGTKNTIKTNSNICKKVKTSKLETSAGWKKLSELCDESSSKTAETEEQRTSQSTVNSETYSVGNQTVQDSENACESSSIYSVDFESSRKFQSENYASPASSCADKTISSTTVDNQQPETSVIQNKGTGKSAKHILQSSLERDIETLFGDPDDEDSRSSQNLKSSDRKKTFTDSGRASSKNENSKESKEKELVLEMGIRGEDSATTAHNNEHQSLDKKLVVDKRKKKQSRQRSADGDYTCDVKNSFFKRNQNKESSVSSPMRDIDTSLISVNSSSCKPHEQHKKPDRSKKLDESREEARASAERRKKEKEILMKKEREEIERQKREVEEKELKRAAERERKRKEEELREAREKEERERRRREREDRERLRKCKEKEEKIRSSDNFRRQRERVEEGKPKKDPKSSQWCEIRNESNETSILDSLFGTDDGLKPAAKIPVREELRRKPEECQSRSSPLQKAAGKGKVSKENYHVKCEKTDRNVDGKAAKNEKDNHSIIPSDALDSLLNSIAANPSTSRKDEQDAVENKLCKQVVVSGINKGRDFLLVGGGHSARVGMVLEKATRIRTKYEHEEKMKHECRKLEIVRRTTGPLEHSTRKRILDMPVPKTQDLLSQILKPDTSYNDPSRRTISAKNINNSLEPNMVNVSSKSPLSSHSCTTVISSALSSVEQKSSFHSGTSDINPSSIQNKKPRLDMAAIDAVLLSLHGLDRSDTSSSFSPCTSSSSSEPKII